MSHTTARPISGTWAGQLHQPSLQKSPFWFLLGQAEGAFVGTACFIDLSQSTTQVRLGRMRQVIGRQFPSRKQAVYEGQPGCWTVTHRDRHRAVEFDNRRRLSLQEHIIQTDDTPQSVADAVGARAWVAAMAD